MTLSTRDTRTLVPVTVEIRDARDPVSVVIRESKGAVGFLVDLKRRRDAFQGEFWLEKPGLYEAVARDAEGSMSETFVVREQIFLPFLAEFGLFSIVLTLSALGVVLWHKRRTKPRNA